MMHPPPHPRRFQPSVSQVNFFLRAEASGVIVLSSSVFSMPCPTTHVSNISYFRSPPPLNHVKTKLHPPPYLTSVHTKPIKSVLHAHSPNSGEGDDCEVQGIVPLPSWLVEGTRSLVVPQSPLDAEQDRRGHENNTNNLSATAHEASRCSVTTLSLTRPS